LKDLARDGIEVDEDAKPVGVGPGEG